jgi:transcriptional regulator with XRE-family HTH domain
MKNRTTIEGFGKKLAHLRKVKGLTQKELGEKAGVSNRVIAYYERETKYPPSHLIGPLAQALEVTADELLGLKSPTTEGNGFSLKLVRRMQRIEALPSSQQKFLLRTIDTFLKGAEK